MKKINWKKNEGFTLIELMIVVAIIGILAAIAIPNFVRFQLRSKAGEGKLNLVAIRSAEGGYFGEYGTYIFMAPEPFTTGGVVVGSNKRPWAVCPGAITMASPGHCIMGFIPEGPTYYDYEVATNLGNNTGISPGTTNNEYFAEAVSDIDSDTTLNFWGLAVGTSPGVAPATAAPTNCVNVLDDTGNTGLLGQVGPCGVGFGINVF